MSPGRRWLREPYRQRARGAKRLMDLAPSPTATMTATRTTTVAPPPSRRTGSAAVVETTQVHVQNHAQAKAVYDYSSGDSGDLSVQSGQVVNVIEKTSADCESLSPGRGTCTGTRRCFCIGPGGRMADGLRVDVSRCEWQTRTGTVELSAAAVSLFFESRYGRGTGTNEGRPRELYGHRQRVKGGKKGRKACSTCAA